MNADYANNSIFSCSLRFYFFVTWLDTCGKIPHCSRNKKKSPEIYANLFARCVDIWKVINHFTSMEKKKIIQKIKKDPQVSDDGT